MKKHYIKPAIKQELSALTTMICISGVGNTADLDESITGETTDQALSRQHGRWDAEDDWDEEF